MKQLSQSIAVLLLLAAAGCGQSGPLYLPGNPSEVREPPQTESTEDDDEAQKPRNDS